MQLRLDFLLLLAIPPETHLNRIPPEQREDGHCFLNVFVAIAAFAIRIRRSEIVLNGSPLQRIAFHRQYFKRQQEVLYTFFLYFLRVLCYLSAAMRLPDFFV